MAPNNMDTREDFDAGERRALEALARHYSEASENIAPPDELRAKILAAAEQSVRASAGERRPAWRGKWLGGFAFALSALLAVVAVLNRGHDDAGEGMLTPAEVTPVEPSGLPAGDGSSATLPAPPASRGGSCAVQKPAAGAPRADWEAEFQRLADQGCNASMAELQRIYSTEPGAGTNQKLTGKQE